MTGNSSSPANRPRKIEQNLRAVGTAAPTGLASVEKVNSIGGRTLLRGRISFHGRKSCWRGGQDVSLPILKENLRVCKHHEVRSAGSAPETCRRTKHVSFAPSHRPSCPQVAQMEEYMKTLDTNLAPLSEALETMMECNEVSKRRNGEKYFRPTKLCGRC